MGTIDRERINYLAALEAQEDFDKKSKEITEPEQETQKKDETNDDKMDVEESKGSDETQEMEASAVST